MSKSQEFLQGVSCPICKSFTSWRVLFQKAGEPNETLARSEAKLGSREMNRICPACKCRFHFTPVFKKKRGWTLRQYQVVDVTDVTIDLEGTMHIVV